MNRLVRLPLFSGKVEGSPWRFFPAYFFCVIHPGWFYTEQYSVVVFTVFILQLQQVSKPTQKYLFYFESRLDHGDKYDTKIQVQWSFVKCLLMFSHIFSNVHAFSRAFSSLHIFSNAFSCSISLSVIYNNFITVTHE